MVAHNRPVDPNTRRATIFGLLTTALTGCATPAPAVTRPFLRRLPPSQQDWTTVETAMGSAIVIRVRVDDQACWAVLDSGASISVIDETLAGRLNLDRQDAVRLQSDAGQGQAHMVAACDLTFAGHKLSLKRFIAAPLASLTLTVGRPISFIVGQDVFEAGLINLDLPNQRIAFKPSGQGLALSEFRCVPLLRGAHGRRLLPIQIGVLKTLPAVFDLGSSSGLMIAESLSRQHALTKGRKTSSAAISTLTGLQTSTVCCLGPLSLAGYALGTVPTDIVPGWLDDEALANVGLPVLRRFRIVADFSSDRLWMSASAADLNLPYTPDRSGLGVAYRGDHLEVMFVAKNSPAEADGWRAGERIIAINGRTVDAAYSRNGLYLWRSDRRRRFVTLTTPERKTTLQLRDYY